MLKTATQIAVERAESLEAIPKMTHPLSTHWDQPDRSRILVDEQHAVMDQRTFDELAEYSCSQPSGVYEGKMWKRHDGSFDAQFIRSGGKPEWLLCWYGPSAKPDHCSVNYRKILISR